MKAPTTGYAMHDEHEDTTGTTKTGSTSVVSSWRCVRRLSRRLAVALLVAAPVVVTSACTTTRAATPVERPALEVPPPPPRVVVPLPPPPPEPLEPVGNLGPGAPALTPRPRPQRDKETAKPEAKPEETKPAEPAPPTPATPPPATPQIRMPETANAQQLAGQINASIIRTREIVGKVDPARLGNVHRKAHEEARLFAQQAEDALKANNLAFAKELADKAERLAKELPGRW